MERKRKFSKKERPKQLGCSKSITELDYDVLKEILIRVAKSSDGAKSLVRAVSTCKALWGLVEDRDVLMAVAFGKLFVPERCELFQQTGGLVTRCARAGHEKALFILAKIIVVSSSNLESLIMTANCDDDLPLAHYLKQRTQSYSFIQNFLPNSCGESQRGLIHLDLVYLLFSQAKVTDFVEMVPYMSGYLRYFFGSLSESIRLFPSDDKDACVISTALRAESKLMGACKKIYDWSFTLIQDSKSMDEHTFSLWRNCKVKHGHFIVQLAEVEKRDFNDANFYSLNFYEAVIEILQTVRAVVEKEIVADGTREAFFGAIAEMERTVAICKMFVSCYFEHIAKASSSFDELCEHLRSGEK